MKKKNFHLKSESHFNKISIAPPMEEVVFQFEDFKTITMNSVINIDDIDSFLESIRENIQKHTENFNKLKQSYETQMMLECEYRIYRIDEQGKSRSMTFNTKALEIFEAKNISEFILKHFLNLKN